MTTLLHVVGARPNFMKAAPVMAAARAHAGTRQILVHTGQHYDRSMSEAFFEDLDLPQPDQNLGVGPAPTRSRPPASCWGSSRWWTAIGPTG